MTNLFQRASSHWVKYSEYELTKTADGMRYIKPAPKAKPVVYDPLKDADAMVVDALNVGLLQMRNAGDKELSAALLEFVRKYGLLGFMTALPTTPEFTNYDTVYLPKNHFIKEEVMSVTDYAALFFPFEKPEFVKDKNTASFSVSGDNDMMALSLTFSDKSMAMNMSFQREYAERYDWLLTQFKDLSFTFLSSILYYKDYDNIDEPTRDLYRRGMAAFGGIAPTYHIALLEKPTIVWDFHSLLLGLQMMFSFMLTDETKPLRACRHCNKAFIAGHPNVAFCNSKCKNQHNVYKSRAKKG